MGKQLVWHERYKIGVDIIDREHKKLFGIINRLLLAREEENKSKWVCQEGLKYFKDHSMRHFTEEEAYMASIDYVGFETHRRLHDNFRQKTLPELERELETTGYTTDSVNHFLGVCAGWLLGHTLMEDHAITGKRSSKWTELLPEEQQVAMRQIIIKLLYDLFRLDAKVISERYGGERFGEGIYYRLLYNTPKNEKWEIIMVFEQKLILNTIGKMMGTQSKEVNVMLMNATRYSAQQFVDCIKEYLPFADFDELVEENLMTYEQFHRVFERENPQYSLLFNTGGQGYFAFCGVAPHLLQNRSGGVGASIKAENAVAEITKYLEKDDNSQKNKILVVDDSSVICTAMKELLGKDYQVSSVNSGLAAIRSIMLNRPHLVLLDYEMPVCDGPQVLGMIRAEEDFADIPVIFLTGRADKDSIRRVMDLKPAGYLLKSMKPAELKKNIDMHFQKKN